jgi:DNA invertase Pin-like site-specific DNA recombinase
MLTIMGGIAEFERGLIRKHTDEGVERARKQGKKFGRPERLDAARSGATIPELAEEYGVGVSTIWRALQPLNAAAA